MISSRSRTDEWIQSVRGRLDPGLAEKMILAFSLVETLQQSGFPFLFKGGTSLSLIIGTLKRFSIDIDVVCLPNQLIEPYLQFVIEQGNFTRFEEDKRQSELPKTHYKLFYTSSYSSSFENEHYVLLDILFEEPLYAKTFHVDLRSPLLEIEDAPTKLLCPTPECLLGDKLTAFAPHTTGISFFKNMELEIVKQLHDVALLFDHITEVTDFYQTYESIANAELGYRNLRSKSVRDVALDTFDTSLMIGLRGETKIENSHQEFNEISLGVKKLAAYIYNDRFTQETAILSSAKTAYLTALFLTQQPILHFYEAEKASSIYPWVIDDPILSQLNRLRKTNLEAFYYFHLALELLKRI